MTVTPPAVQPMGLAARIIGVITAPRPTFESVVAHPRPVGVLFVSALVMSLATMVPLLMSEELRQASTQMGVEMMERFTGRPLNAEEMAAVERRATTQIYLTPLNFFIGMPVICLLFAAIYWVAFNAVLGGTGSFKQVLAVVTHSQVIGALGVLLAAPIQYAQGRLSMAGPFTIGPLLSFLPEASFWRTLLGSTSVFTIWSLIVTAIGLAVLYRRKTRNIAIALLIAYFAIAAAVISLFGGMFGTGR